MHDALRAFHTLNLIAFIALGVVALITWYRRRDDASGWAAAAFGSLAALELLSLIPTHEHNLGQKVVTRFEVVIVVVFPYLLFRFTNAFRRPARALAWALAGLTAILVVWACAIPRYPQSGEPRSGGFQAFIIVFLVHWTILSIAAATLLWRAGREQPTVARRRMQYLAFASAVLTLALILILPTSDSNSVWTLGTQLLGFAAVIAFLVGFAPPQVLRVLWRAPEAERFQAAMASLLTFAETQEEVASRVLEPAAQMVGARAAAIRNSEGTLVGAWKIPGDGERWPGAELVEAEAPGATITVWTTPEAPFFGEE